MTHLKIRKLIYDGDLYAYESPFLKDGINVLVGGNGTGKSTFMNLMYFGLGGTVWEFREGTGKHKEICGDINNSVQLTIDIGEERFSLTRFFKDSTFIQIANVNDDSLEIFPINRNSKLMTNKTFSDWLLEKLGIQPIEISYGTYQRKININDLFRLIYHNQTGDTAKIFKEPDNDNFLTESVFIRKAIFEILMGKNNIDLYSTFIKIRNLEKDKQIIKGTLDNIQSTIKELYQREDINLFHLNKEKEELEKSLGSFESHKKSIEINRDGSSERKEQQLNELRQQLNILESTILDLNRKKNESINQLASFNNLLKDSLLEVSHIGKIINTHEKLSLFSNNTCPICLHEINREPGLCICGNKINEDEFEHFIYTKDEYADILKSKQKSINTIKDAKEIIEKQLDEINNELENKEEVFSNLKMDIKQIINTFKDKIDIKELNSIDKEIFSVKNNINQIAQQIELEKKRTEVQKQFDETEELVSSLRADLKQLEGLANADILVKIREFNNTFNLLMTQTVPEIHSAKIDVEDYMPLINDGQYTQASAKVAIRFNYYFTLLKLSLLHKDIKFPSFLMIDTVENLGIDGCELLTLIDKAYEEVLKKCDISEYQVIFTTGEGKYPDSFESYIIGEHMTIENKLLKLK